MSILIRNIYYMLSYAFTSLRPEAEDKIAGTEFSNIHNLFAAILEKGLGQLLKRGLHRDYVGRADDLPVLRGKVDMAGAIRNRMANRRLIACEYDELSEDTPFNRILKTTALLLLRQEEVKAEYRRALRKELHVFAEVGTVEPSRIAWSSLRFQRNNRNYRLLLGLCRFILEGMLLTTEQGEHRLATFVDEQRLCRLYEKFLLEYYRRECPWLSARPARIAWALDDGADALLPAMQSDIMLSCGARSLIIDAKYYTRSLQERYGTYSQHSSNLYQLFTYVKNHAATEPGQEVSGLLLYARTTESVQPDAEYRMSGNRISVGTLDLNGEFEAIERCLNGIAEQLRA